MICVESRYYPVFRPENEWWGICDRDKDGEEALIGESGNDVAKIMLALRMEEILNRYEEETIEAYEKENRPPLEQMSEGATKEQPKSNQRATDA